MNVPAALAILDALAVLVDIVITEDTITREDLPFIRADIEKARREFTEEELTEDEHAARLEALAVLEANL